VTRVHLNKKNKFIKKINKNTYFFKKIKIQKNKKKKKKLQGVAGGGQATPKWVA
jgi:hypothetical protein